MQPTACDVEHGKAEPNSIFGRKNKNNSTSLSELMKKIIVAIDGYSSCGKSTMAKQLAAALGYTYVDTGAMYRAVTLYALRNGYINMQSKQVDTAKLLPSMSDISIGFARNAEGKAVTTLNGEDVEAAIRSMEVARWVSHVAVIAEVRHHLVLQQQRMGSQKGIVMDGRDIGTVVFPDAELKIFVTASAEVRARRRYKELTDKGKPANYDDILANVQERDRIDTTRSVSPLRKADDALVLDNSNLTPEQQLRWLIAKVEEYADK